MIPGKIVVKLESWLFGHRFATLVALLAFTIMMGAFAVHLRMSTSFDKQLPQGHEYVQTFMQYREQLFGANRVTVVLHARKGDIWSKPILTQLLAVTDAVTYLPGIDRGTVTSIWTPNVFFTEITEDGFKAEPVTGGEIVPEKLTREIIAQIRARSIAGGHVGTLVARDHTSAMITAELVDKDPRTGKKLDYIEFNRLLEEKIRKPYENDEVEIQIIGFAKQMGDVAAGARDALLFFGLAFLVTALAAYWYCHSIRLTLLPLLCSLVSLVWQFGTLRILDYTLDPLAILVPFLVFAIGISHGIQQINFIVREVANGENVYTASRRSFSNLLVPGALALITAFASFATLLLIPIPVIQELAIVASIGVAYKIITNLLMLPVIASYFNVTQGFARKALLKREQRNRWLAMLAGIAAPKNAVIVTVAGVLILAIAVWQSQGRHIGSLEAGAPELRPSARFNLDATSIVRKFDVGLDWLTVVFEVAPDKEGDACSRPDVLLFIDDFSWQMSSIPGVISTDSLASQLKLYNAGMNEGNPKMATITRDPHGLGSEFQGVNNRIAGLSSSDCQVQGVNLYLSDHKATTIQRVIDAVNSFREKNHLKGVVIRLASGNAGVLAATNDVLAQSELPMMLYVYAAIILFVFFAYRDWRAVLVCCLPLTVATWIGYWFMRMLDIGLTVSTLPVMVLAVGIGVDYAFYIYNRLQLHLGQGVILSEALENTLRETGVATVFTALTLTVGVALWAFSPLKFQADMGMLLAFMFTVNMLTAITLLPAFVVVLDILAPRRTSVRVPSVFYH